MEKNIKILLINPPSDCVDEDRIEPPLGLLYIASTLRQKGYNNISVFDMTGCKNELEILNKISSIPNSDIYGISCFSTNYQFVKKVINHIKKNNPSSYIIVGGPHPSGLPDFTLKDSKCDVVVVGEGEDIFTYLLDKFLKGLSIKGVVYGRGRRDINSYPFPARELVDISTYSRKLMNKPVISILSSRGCKHHCIHCNSVVMGGGNMNVRYRSSENIIKEIKELKNKGFNYFRFNDDHFSGNPYLEELLKKMRELNINFRIFARIEDLNNKTCKLLKEAGCIHVSIGLESLNPNNLKIIGKASQIGKENNVKIAKKHGLTIRSSFMVGLPYDSDKTIESSFKKAAELGTDEFSIYALIPYPGTLIWKYPERFGYKIINKDFSNYVQMGRNKKTFCALDHENFSHHDVERWVKIANNIIKLKGAKHMSESKIAK